MNIVAVDTGGTAGVAQWRDDFCGYGEIVDGKMIGFKWWQLPGWEAVDLIAHEGTTGRPDVLVVEKLVIQQRARKTKGEVLEAVEQLGALRFWAKWLGVDFELSPPADAMNFSTDDKLRKAGMYVPKEHARDAARHLLLKMVVNRVGPDPATLV